MRLPAAYDGAVPPNLTMMDVPEAEYLVFEHGPFDYEQENRSVEGKIEEAMATFDFDGTGYRFDTEPGRVLYFYHDPRALLEVREAGEEGVAPPSWRGMPFGMRASYPAPIARRPRCESAAETRPSARTLHPRSSTCELLPGNDSTRPLARAGASMGS